jgi:site-specific recombinase XerD
MSALAPTLQAWFTDRLIAQRNVSPHTIRAYRDTLRLLLNYAESWLGRQPSQLDISQLDAPLIAGFLDHLETDRGNTVTTRNLRLAAIHSLFGYAQHRHPEHAQDIARVLAIPLKRADRAIVTFLDDNEIEALLDAPDRSTWTGRRDHALLVLAVQTGLRASELTGLRCGDVQLTTGPHVRCPGKGRKNRITPLTPTTTAILEVWLAERAGNRDEPAFPTARGGRLTRDALDHRIAKYVEIAAQRCPTLHEKRVTPHTPA